VPKFLRLGLPLRIVSVTGCSIKGNVKENVFPSTGSEEELRDFQPLPAMQDA